MSSTQDYPQCVSRRSAPTNCSHLPLSVTGRVFHVTVVRGTDLVCGVSVASGRKTVSSLRQEDSSLRQANSVTNCCAAAHQLSMLCGLLPHFCACHRQRLCVYQVSSTTAEQSTVLWLWQSSPHQC
jgi:hypothetical protein